MDQAQLLRFGPYAVRREIARGGMGVVYEAEDLAGIRVALKIPRSELATDQRERARFLQEMRLTAALHHPNIVQILQGGDDRGQLYLAMEYVEGSTLQHELDRRGKLPPLELVRIAAQVARGLAAAHGHTPAVVHRDLKPGNILLRSDGVAKVADFGIAKAFDIGAAATTSPMGTPVYMCPEQLNGQLSSPASDVHALGVILYEALVGIPPFAPTLAVARLIHAICFDVPPAVSAASGLAAAVPSELDALVADCLAKSPEQRPHAFEVAAQLQTIETLLLRGAEPHPASPSSTPGARVVPPPVDTIALVARFERRSYAAPVIAGAALLGIAGLGAWMLWRRAATEDTEAIDRVATSAAELRTSLANASAPLPPQATAREPAAAVPADVAPSGVLEGLTAASGPYPSFDQFCKQGRAANPDSIDFATCELAKDPAAANAAIPGLGQVRAIATGEGVFNTEYGLAFTLESGTYVTRDLISVGGGNEQYSTIHEMRILPAERTGQVAVDIVVEKNTRIDDGSGRPGADMDWIKIRQSSGFDCGVASDRTPGCRPRRAVPALSSDFVKPCKGDASAWSGSWAFHSKATGGNWAGSKARYDTDLVASGCRLTGTAIRHQGQRRNAYIVAGVVDEDGTAELNYGSTKQVSVSGKWVLDGGATGIFGSDAGDSSGTIRIERRVAGF